MNLSGMQVIVVSHQEQRNEQPTYKSMKPRLAKQLIGLGVVHILVGLSCTIFQSIGLWNFVNISGNDIVSEYFSLAVAGHGFWSGFLFLVTGIIGIAAGIRKSKCQVVAITIFSIISAVFSTILFILAAVSVYIGIREFRARYENIYKPATKTQATTILVMESLLAVMGIVEGIISICSSIVCCLIGACSCCHAPQPQTQPLILSAEQQAALMSNQLFLSNPQQSTVGIYPQQQTVQYNKPLPDAPPHAHNNFMSVAMVEGSYTDLNTGMRRDLPSPDTEASACIATSTYEDLHYYEELGPAVKS